MEDKMNVLSKEKQIQIVSALVEGNSVRATARMSGVEHKTVLRVLLRVGENCRCVLDTELRGIKSRFVQVDEIWTYVGVKEARLRPHHNHSTMGDQYVFVAMDAESKLVPTFRVGKRNAENCYFLMQDLRERLATRVQLTTDGFRPYINAVEDNFGAGIDYAMLIKTYSELTTGEKRYSPAQIVNALPIPVAGDPKSWMISTSHIERQNLTMRMQLRRFTRLTNGFSKKLDNLKAALSLHFAWYNFCRIHSSLRVTPAMASNVVSEVWPLDRLIA
jgi:IS1 family transposase